VAHEDPDGDVEPIGAVLARMRRHTRLTGQELGRMVGMSQAKISRIETGQTSASPADVARIARALGASAPTVEDLVARAEQSHYRLTDWRPSPGAMGRRQEDIGALEAAASVIRVFQPVVVVGLAQTADYARAIIASMRVANAVPQEPGEEPSLATAVTGRVRRQEIVAQANRRFHFIMGEGALRSRLASAAEMIVQIDRLRRLGQAENVRIQFIAGDAVLPFPLLHGFELLDDACVIVDVFNTGLVGRGARDLITYRRIFDQLEAVATTDPEPMLRKYRDVYLRELTRDDESAS
jgi:transcriptional regulator with XRE-family HTH domain